MSSVRIRGSWPDRVAIRRGWAAAVARPWNDQTEAVASLRLDRGGDRFLEACCEWLSGQGVELIRSPALGEAQTGVWRRAGFDDHMELVVFERALSDAVPAPTRAVVELPAPDLVMLAAMDDRAFEADWRVGRWGLEDALAATPSAVVLAVTDEGETLGFAIVGEISGVAYLQRLAVEPARTRAGVGSSLVRAALTWAKRRGAHTMLLNTQPDNAAAAGLYRSESFVALRPRLAVLARSVGS